MYSEPKNIMVLDKNFNNIGVLSNQGANPQAPYYDDLYIQELDTGADIYQFSAPSTAYTRSILVIGNHIAFEFNNRQEMFTISSIELEHRNGYNTIGVYAEGIGFELLEIYIRKQKTTESDSGSSGGNDSDNDGDDNFDDEYADPDNVMIDENGNIIYIPDKEASNYANPDNVIIDEDGNISYQPNKDKNSYNKNKDSELKFKLSYPDFLKLVLKKTDWSYECQPGLEKNIVETSIKYDTNIYALLQESMQTYKGVELEFVYEYYGNPKKVVRAYNNGGRGSFIGKRFEYGSNVAGIVKNEEIINVEDDTILFVDGFEDIGIEVNYEVDFALKSLDITDMNIGDTHYVLDRDFNPSQFKARIGKIEISFSDRTKNKIYLANSKKIKGNTPEEFENLDPIIDDPGIEDPEDPNDPILMTDALFKAPRMHSYEFLLYTNRTFGKFSVSERMNDYTNITDGMSIREDVPKTEELYNFIVNEAKVYDCSPVALDNIRGVIDSNYCLRLFPQNYCKNENCSSMSLAASRVFSTMINRETDLPDFHDISKNDHYDEHMLDVGSLTCALVSAMQHHVKKDHGGDGGDFENLKVSKWITVGTETSPQGDAVGIKLLCSGRETKITPGGITAMDIDANSVDSKQMTVSDTLDAKRIRVYGDGLHIFSSITFADGSVLTSAKGLGGGSNPDNPDDPSTPGDSSSYATKDFVYGYVDGQIADAKGYMENFCLDNHNSLSLTVSNNKKDLQDQIDDLQDQIDDISSGGSDVGGDLGIPDGVIVYSTEEEAEGFDPPFLCLNNANVKVENSLLVDGMVYAPSIWTDDFYTDTVKCDRITKGAQGANYPLEFDCDVIFNGNVSGINGSGGTDVGLYLNQNNIMVPHSLMPTNENCNIGRPDGGATWDSVYCNHIKADSISSLVDLSVDDLYVTRINGASYTAGSDISLKENVRYIDPTRNIQLLNGDETNNNEDLLEKADLYDFIVNQVSLCEFNYIGDATNKIGFIANEYEGTKVGDKIVFSQEFKTKDIEGNVIETTEHLTYDITNLLFATIGALQEEVRVRDEEINSLKSRLEAIEAKLGL